MTRILVVEDEPGIAFGLESDLQTEGYQVVVVGDGAEAVRRAGAEAFDLILLDVMLPNKDGFEVCRELRHGGLKTPIILLTAKTQEAEKVLGLDVGADDYVTKPFSPRELALRVRSVLRRSRGTGLPDKPDLGSITDGNLVVNLAAHEASVDGKLLQLTSREYDLLVFLMRNPRKAFTREQLLSEVWSWTFGDTSTVTVHVRRLREKLEPDPTMPRRIATVWGVGYRYEPEAA